jgi:hypothetical protein
MGYGYPEKKFHLVSGIKFISRAIETAFGVKFTEFFVIGSKLGRPRSLLIPHGV